MKGSRLPPKFQKKINQLVKLLLKINPERIILFGSLATGRAERDSDIDLCIIKKTNDPWKIKDKISDLMWSRKVGFDPEPDFHVYSPKIYYDWLEREDPFLAEIEKGKVLYEKK